MRPFRFLFPLLALGLVASLGSCGICSESGLCPVAPYEGSATAGNDTVQRLARGTTTRVPLTVQPIDLPDGALLVFGTKLPDATGNVLDRFDNGKVVVSWDGVPFDVNHAALTVTVASDATLSGPELTDSEFTNHVLIKMQGARYRAGGVVLGILVVP
ncbi:hypothetical protein [Deinococcus sonorensis]|uniref:Uncharacterized protein n=1 Tax=Deinococcus sonorensis TaxID=309891 RepID=A0ABV8YBJ9_9DEIO